ncbi:sensor protein [Candidatus Scalindua japonica]|uniref:Sensor protein n=1 Tax=Candidatus Scalindua japonica TaxID=1284222 RepID=A0A286TTR8_9BACT|nr:DICT sensory domain-containing protein [Candidatus Scalindua japonica]GAX59264.1 sensor protein [Candidatus Scalindua japonica]
MLDKNNIFHDLIVEVRALTVSHDPTPLFDDLQLESLDGECHFTSSRRTLLMMSRVIEDTLKLHKKRCLLYSGFQELSRFNEHRERYTKLAACADQIFVVGVADVHVADIAENVHVKTKNADIIRNNWISIITSKTINISLIAQELTSQNHHEGYIGFYTNSKSLTEKAVDLLINNNVLSDDPVPGKQTSFNI